MPKDTRKDKDEDSGRKILEKLQTLERRIKRIEKSLKRKDDDARLVNEDQLFFGLALSIALLLVTLPDFDVSKIFENFGLLIPPVTGILTTKELLIGSLILASGFRYYVTFVQVNQEKQFRVVSVSCLIFPIYWLVFEFTVRGLVTILRNVSVNLVFFAPLIIAIFAVLFGKFVERKWYSNYGKYPPFLSVVFATLALFIIIALELGAAVSLFFPTSESLITVELLVSLAITLVIFFALSSHSFRRVQNWFTR